MPSILTQIVSTSVATQISRNEATRTNQPLSPVQVSIAAQSEAARVTISHTKDKDRVPSREKKVDGIFAIQESPDSEHDKDEQKEEEKSDPKERSNRLAIKV